MNYENRKIILEHLRDLVFGENSQRNVREQIKDINIYGSTGYATSENSLMVQYSEKCPFEIEFKAVDELKKIFGSDFGRCTGSISFNRSCYSGINTETAEGILLESAQNALQLRLEKKAVDESDYPVSQNSKEIVKSYLPLKLGH